MQTYSIMYACMNVLHGTFNIIKFYATSNKDVKPKNKRCKTVNDHFKDLLL